MELEGFIVKETFSLLELGGIDVILGVAWLAKLGDVRLNWKNLSMSFMDQGRMIYIRGDPSLSKKMVDPQSLRKEKDIFVLSICWNIEREKLGEKEARGEELTWEQKEELEKIIQDSQGVFAEPVELPPRRTVGHKIPLKEGVEVVNVRPYKYPHVLKTEIEKQVWEMLKAGII